MTIGLIGRFSVTTVGAVVLFLGATSAAKGQVIPSTSQPNRQTETGDQGDEAVTQNEGLGQVARSADTGIGEVGQRLTMRDAAPLQEPLDRISSRINNRIENRIRNRIDRTYDPTANATSPYVVVDSQMRAARISGPR